MSLKTDFNRRTFLGGLIAAPALIPAHRLMRIPRPWVETFRLPDFRDYQNQPWGSNLAGLPAIYMISTTSNERRPAGLICPHLRNELVDGWLRCDGRKLTIWQYPELFKVIGKSYGRTVE